MQSLARVGYSQNRIQGYEQGNVVNMDPELAITATNTLQQAISANGIQSLIEQFHSDPSKIKEMVQNTEYGEYLKMFPVNDQESSFRRIDVKKEIYQDSKKKALFKTRQSVIKKLTSKIMDCKMTEMFIVKWSEELKAREQTALYNDDVLWLPQLSEKLSIPTCIFYADFPTRNLPFSSDLDLRDYKSNETRKDRIQIFMISVAFQRLIQNLRAIAKVQQTPIKNLDSDHLEVRNALSNFVNTCVNSLTNQQQTPQAAVATALGIKAKYQTTSNPHVRIIKDILSTVKLDSVTDKGELKPNFEIEIIGIKVKDSDEENIQTVNDYYQRQQDPAQQQEQIVDQGVKVADKVGVDKNGKN